MHPKALLDACSELVRLVLKCEHPADAVVSKFFRENRALGSRERATLAETAYTVLRKRLVYEYFARSGSGPKERRMAILGFYGPGDFLRSALSDPEKRWLDQCQAVVPTDLMEHHRHNLPDWLVDPLKAQLGDEFWSLVEHLNGGAGLDLRVNDMKVKRSDVQKELQKSGVASVPTPFSPLGLRISGKPNLSKNEQFLRGDFEIQDEGSQLITMLTDAKRGEMVVDFCAGAGGKTLALGAAMRSTGRLYAFDTSAHRLEALRPRMARSGLSNVYPTVIAHERDDRVKRLSGKLDRVLVDAPCSGMGTLRRNPDLKWRQTMAAVEEMAVKQSAILQSAARMVKSGGRLVYATCSLLTQENEGVADAFSVANPDFIPLPVATVLTELKVQNTPSLCGGGEHGTLYLRLWPHVHQTDGFFAAVWQKK